MGVYASKRRFRIDEIKRLVNDMKSKGQIIDKDKFVSLLSMRWQVNRKIPQELVSTLCDVDEIDSSVFMTKEERTMNEALKRTIQKQTNDD